MNYVYPPPGVLPDGWCRAEEIPKEWEGRQGWCWHMNYVRRVERCVIPVDFDRRLRACANTYFKLYEPMLPPADWYVWESKAHSEGRDLQSVE